MNLRRLLLGQREFACDTPLSFESAVKKLGEFNERAQLVHGWWPLDVDVSDPSSVPPRSSKIDISWPRVQIGFWGELRESDRGARVQGLSGSGTYPSLMFLSLPLWPVAIQLCETGKAHFDFFNLALWLFWLILVHGIAARSGKRVTQVLESLLSDSSEAAG